MNRVLPALAAICLFLAACSKNIQTKDAVLKGITTHLSKRTDMPLSSMKIEISSVNFRGNEADALVSFTPQGMEGSAGMQMRYTLERKGNEWVVKGRADSGGHGAPGGMPGGTAPGGSGSTLPPDHPPIGSGQTPGPRK
ncbi:MAG: hypothetical protein IT161_04670 [Bryobacterales bacterium]|nr:hypothetical protein [Bryobacterales bacterium]